MDYLKMTIADIDETEQEVLIAFLSENNFIGFEQKENHLLAYAENGLVINEDLKTILAQHTVQEETIPEVNWNEKWERDFEPIILEDKVAIRAHFHKTISSVKHEIVVTPKMSFGTGHHATTQQMLRHMSVLNLAGKKVFDYGTGTGVLAIYAEMLGAEKVIANDIDPWSEENALENVARNNCQKIEIRLGGLEVVSEVDFDCILANINLNVLKVTIPSLFKMLKKGENGLILSGILQENEQEIVDCIKPYSADYQVYQQDKWLCITVKK